MEILMWIIVAVVGVILFMRFNMGRAKKFARAAMYLRMIEDGESVENANQTASFAFSKYDTSDWETDVALAKQYAQQHYGGKQLPVIAAARAKGFRG